MKRKLDLNESDQESKIARTDLEVAYVELPTEIWHSVLSWLDLEDRAEQLVASVSKVFYEIILRFVEEEALEIWPEFIPKLKSIDDEHYRLIGTMRRMLEVYYNDYLIVNYLTLRWICPLCNKLVSGMKSSASSNENHLAFITFSKYTCSCTNCNLKYGKTITWDDNGRNSRTEVCPTCKLLTKSPEFHCLRSERDPDVPLRRGSTGSSTKKYQVYN